ncbi:spermidine/putrescine ABC transporter substrate-binding protein [Paenibacillus sp. 32O-W]|uniref:ABC transporter substrate-binding protein n=1 Tax=Paenibacillus sp. 32O-W TaxID=1695218 RepID=UPI00071F22A2|nr:ABC transporter substrate-binding protein [Paenibacillus sp. 32O-W]ALS25473.1 spermidine/putrescine ABC transporter substrate-binding protein [Paenibacillus sp. 32O-W]
MRAGGRRKYTTKAILSIILASVLMIAGCGDSKSSEGSGNGSESSGKSELVVTSFGGKYDEVFKKYVVEPFEAANPGVKVTLAPYTGVAKLAQGGGEQIDVVQLDDFDLIEAGNKQLLQPLKKEAFTQWDNLYPQAFLNGSGNETYGLTNVFGSWGIAYNPDKVDKPESWNDLWAPEVQGKVALMSQWIPDILLTAKAVNATEDNMDPVWEAFKAITPSVAQYYSSFSAPESLFGTGEITMAAWFDGRAIALKEAGQSVDFVIPKEGGVLIRSGLGVLKSSKNQELAQKLIDFSLTPEAQKGFAEELFYGPTNETVELEAELQKKVVYGKESLDQLLAPDWNSLLSKREDWLTKWTEATMQ